MLEPKKIKGSSLPIDSRKFIFLNWKIVIFFFLNVISILLEKVDCWKCCCSMFLLAQGGRIYSIYGSNEDDIFLHSSLRILFDSR